MTSHDAKLAAPQGYCKKCILRLHTVDHTPEGVCKYCAEHDWDRPWDAGKQEFIDTLAGFCGKGKKGFDVLCPVTGGKDSTFALYALRKFVPEARVLAFTWDHGFHSSWKNILSAVEAAGVQHEIYRFGDTEEDALRVTHEYHRRFGVPCSICRNQPLVVYWAALKYQIPLLVWGSIQGQNGRVDKQGLLAETVGTPEQNRAIMRMGIDALLPVLDEILGTALPEKKERILSNLLQPIVEALGDLSLPFAAAMNLGFYFDWNKNEKEVVKLLHDAYGFEKPDETMTHTSCQLAQFRGHGEYLYPKQDQGRELPSKMEFETAMVVRSGAISREQGFAELEQHGISARSPEGTIAEYIEKVGISRAEFDTYAWKKDDWA